MREIVVLSGKGGTGKTSLTAAFAHLASNHVICDLDVDAPDLHLLLSPKPHAQHAFYSGHEAVIWPELCEDCGLCTELCQFSAVGRRNDLPFIDPLKCEGCKLCVALCPAEAIDFPEKHCGRWYRSATRFGPMIHAQLFPGEENSGRLVALLRKQARDDAKSCGATLILADGPPGIGCPAISALSGADLAVIVTEPTPSGRHDLKRALDLCAHFRVPAGVVINKCDLNLEQTAAIAAHCREKGLPLFGQLPHDVAMTKAMVAAKVITEYSHNGLNGRITSIWQKIVETESL